MHKVMPLNPAADMPLAPIPVADGFVTPVGTDLLLRGRLPGTVRRVQGGTLFGPARRTRVLAVGSGTVGRKDALAALSAPDDAGIAAFELVPPPRGRVLTLVTRASVLSASLLFAYGIAMYAAVPAATQALTLRYGGVVPATFSRIMTRVQSEPGMLVLKEDDGENRGRIFDRYRELRAEEKAAEGAGR